ncbi:hypothetical protein MFLAVUS_000556 [Mucor flavus]|uniref:DIS3-like exonuclease 2 n=1 Tax=Mucor flavus TaxID=439312 RepID=A0ABP9YK21_9FUNG
MSYNRNANPYTDSDIRKKKPVETAPPDFGSSFNTNTVKYDNSAPYLPNNTSVGNYSHSNIRNHDRTRTYSTNRSYASYTQPPAQTAVYYQYTNENRSVPTENPKSQRKVYDVSRFQRQNDRLSDDNWRSTARPIKNQYIHPDDVNLTKRNNFFCPYLDPVDTEREIQNGTLYEGVIRITKNRYDAYVTCDGLDADVYIGGLKSRNRSLDGDRVVVQLVEIDAVWDIREERRKERSRQHQQQYQPQQQLPQPKNESVVESTSAVDLDEYTDAELSYKPDYCGEVVGITLRSPNMTFVGTIGSSRTPGQSNNGRFGKNDRAPRFAWFKPLDQRVPLIAIRDDDVPADLITNADAYKKYLYSVTILQWPIYDTSPAGKLMEKIGLLGDLSTERHAILAGNSIVTSDFTPIALAGLPSTPWEIPESEIKQRRDLRQELIFTIDPSTAKDLDDAVHFKVLDDGFYEVGVHIADVGYFLKRGSALDQEALKRGTSTYLVDKVFSMLPPLLCEELCSLNSDVDRLAFSVIWKLDAYGKQLSTWFGKTIIRSRAKLSYEDAQCVIDGDKIPDDVKIYGTHSVSQVSSSIFMLNKLATELRRKRYDYGALSLNSVKLKFELDSQGQPISVSTAEMKEANQLIEEFMLLANISVAKKISSAYPEEALLRRHEPPLQKRLDKFIKTTEELGLDFCGSSAGSLQISFDKVRDKNVKEVLLVLAIRCMQRAKYFCSGNIDIAKYQHYALNEPVYTHFTSPIRRYADVMVHRLLESALEGKQFCGYPQKSVQKITFTCNTKKDGARKAQDSSINLYLAKYLARCEMVKGAVFVKANVIAVAKDSYEIHVPKYGLESKFRLKDLPIQQFEYRNGVLEIHWKPGVPVPMHNNESSTLETNGNGDDEEDEEEECEIIPELDQLMSALSVTNDKDAVKFEEIPCLQLLAVFSKIDVRIQVNETRSPPIINLYPVNPFCEEIVMV